MRIALVSPYSWTYQGGVNRHVEALATEFLGRGHEVRVLAPWDRDDRLTKLMHRGQAERRERPDYLVPLGRTVGIGANGAVSNLSIFPDGVRRLREELRSGDFDVVHVHEPIAPVTGWDAVASCPAPVVGTFHAYSTRPLPNRLATLLGARRIFNKLHARIAVSEAAAWTGRRWFGGDYRVIPNGVDLAAVPNGVKPSSEELRVLFVGRPEVRKGLPVLLTAFAALADHVPAKLAIVGSEKEDVHRYLSDEELNGSVEIHGRVSAPELWRQLQAADVLCAPSLAGESFGMVLIEAFAAGTPVVASEIAGYTDVVNHGTDGVLVAPADPQQLAEALHDMHLQPERRLAMGEAARRTAQRYSWPRVANQVEEVYEVAQHAPAPATKLEAATRRTGFTPADGRAKRPPKRLPPLDPEPQRASRRHRLGRQIGLGVAAVLALGLTALAAQRVGVSNVIDSIVRSDGTWVLLALALMSASLFLRAASWYWIARAALPSRPVRRRDVTSAAMIGVLMSATLPARLGEPARAMVLGRRTGRMRETFPVLLGTIVSQTALNILALAILGAIIVSTTDLFHTNQKALFIVSLAPLLLLLAVIVAPSLVKRGGSGRAARFLAAVRSALVQVRRGLDVFRDPRHGSLAAATQLAAWGLQLVACLALFHALGLDGRAGIGAAAAVLFAVNVTAVVPATPSNVGVFQLAVISVLVGGFGVSGADALAYGIVLQAVEVATAVALGVPALVREGLTWGDMRLRAIQAAPVRLSHRPAERPSESVSS